MMNGIIQELVRAKSKKNIAECTQLRIKEYDFKNIKYREIGEILFRSTKLLDTIPFASGQKKFLDAIEDAVEFLQANYKDCPS